MEETRKQLETLWVFQDIKKELQTKFDTIETAFVGIDFNKSGFIEFDDLAHELDNNHGMEEREYKYHNHSQITVGCF